jgi:hypothetical protein
MSEVLPELPELAPVADRKPGGSLVFIREVVKYFMDFLETDFHKRRIPRRRVKYRNEDGLLVGENLAKYPAFRELLWKRLLSGFDPNSPVHLKPKAYTAAIPTRLLEVVRVQVQDLTELRLQELREDIAEHASIAIPKRLQDYDAALSAFLDSSARAIKKRLVTPIMTGIEQSLEGSRLGDANTFYLMEEEISGILLRTLEGPITETLATGRIDGLLAGMEASLSIEDARRLVLQCFDNFRVRDLFSELLEMDRNRSILDKQEFYFYFCDITYDRVKYPIFYIPFALNRQGDELRCEFDARVYVNTKALDFVVQRHNSEIGRTGSLTCERIIYLAQQREQLPERLQSVMRQVRDLLGLDGDVDMTRCERQESKSLFARVSNSAYVSVYDKSDEALVNDYEKLLELFTKTKNPLAESFAHLVDGFIKKEPLSFDGTIGEEWGGTDTGEKLVYASPVPLNSEQRMIISALNKPDCRFISVEGPPGTGKSHTITAILFDAILKNQSVLVLSDKKEALDVVESKIADTLNRVRHGSDFQNPILRLGKTGSTYSNILSQASLGRIRSHCTAIQGRYEELKGKIDQTALTLKEDIEAEALAYGEISLADIRELVSLEQYFARVGLPFVKDEVLSRPKSAFELEETREVLRSLRELLSNGVLQDFIKLRPRAFDSVADFGFFLSTLVILRDKAKRVSDVFQRNVSCLRDFDLFLKSDRQRLHDFLDDYRKLKNPVFGFLFKRRSVEALDEAFRKAFERATITTPHRMLGRLQEVLKICDFIAELEKDLPSYVVSKIDWVGAMHRYLVEPGPQALNDFVDKAIAGQEHLAGALREYPRTLQLLGIDSLTFDSLVTNRLTGMDDSEFAKLIRFISLFQTVKGQFEDVEPADYAAFMKKIEGWVTMQMTFLLDKRVVDFYEKNKATAATLRDIIRAKRQFPTSEFGQLKEAFPCILSGIRDYAEYIPLEPEIFDLVIIDEASQVSIAQAFPALLRAKKVVVLGDKRQFSNVKSAQARSDMNREYQDRLQRTFKEWVSDDPSSLARALKFNIKTSILEFSEFVANYRTQLTKHFRGYRELISFSNKYFYQRSLQVMKIRGRPIDEVLRFNVLDDKQAPPAITNANRLEADFIVSRLRALRDAGSTASVGVITPHTNQQKLTMETFNQLPDKDDFDGMKLKVMTFDTCQGEERDIVFYSMVATRDQDRLWGVFPKDLSASDSDDSADIRAQRLNVGFSRARECMWFVLSKPLEEFRNSIGGALRHYANVLEEAKKERRPNDVDPDSPMESEVLNWFYQTSFWEKNKKQVELIPQFEIGKYLAQQDEFYDHPLYRSDFLLIFTEGPDRTHRIIIEYDGFLPHHFKSADGIDSLNYREYYTDDDLYREKVIEGYGYRFLRLNKFNIGDNPIATLDAGIKRLVGDSPEPDPLTHQIHGTIAGLQNGSEKVCPKCRQVRKIDDFRDSSRASGWGRFCIQCKSQPIKRVVRAVTPRVTPAVSGSTCPKCGARMVLRVGPYSKFYGCSKFPYCRGTRPCA